MTSEGRRRFASVMLDGLGSTGARTAMCLAEAGVGTLLLRDGRTVGADDVGNPYSTVHQNAPRTAALQDLVKRSGPRTAALECPEDMQPARTDVCVLFTESPAQQRLRAAAAHSTLVLPVSLAGGEAEIGPLFGRSDEQHGFACLGCRELSSPCRTGPDARTAEWTEHVRDAAPPQTRDTLLVQIIAGLVARQLLLLLDGALVPVLADHSMVLRTDGGIDHHPARRHPECICQLSSPELFPS